MLDPYSMMALVFTDTTLPLLWPVGVLTYGMNSLATLRATSLFVLMHSGIVNGYISAQIRCTQKTKLGHFVKYAES